MSRVASSLYDGHFQTLEPPQTANHLNEPSLNRVRLNNNLVSNIRGSTRTPEEWTSIFPTAAFFEGRDIKLGEIVIMVYEDPDSKRINSVLFSALGELYTNSLTLDERSRFFVACENLSSGLKNSNVRRALAITLLKAYSTYNPIDLRSLRKSPIPVAREWDETVAGELASHMQVITTKSPSELGKQLLSFGFFQQQFTDSTNLDVVYSDKEDVIDSNNKLVFLLGQQLEHLFDPLTEYSPESTDVVYKPPENMNNTDDELTRSVCQELFQLQESITTQLVKFLREVVIPTRIKALSGNIPELSAAKVNKIFPPTIDEVTRVNCIFFEALKSAVPFGSYEVMKACGCTIPYFYKAYMRHESALKSFSKDQAEFLEHHTQNLPTTYSNTLISSIMKVPLNLTKIKLILQRLLETKQWNYIEESMIQKFYTSSIDTIDSFGKDDLKPYNRRVFTPTGKILTEICSGWPAMLAYGWLNRKVISVFDVKNNADNSNGIVVLFNDYIVFATIDEENIDESLRKPKISDVLMNSLMNENPIKSIPNMKVTTWTELECLEVLAFGENNVRVVLRNDPQSSMALTVDSSSKFIGLINKAKILGKSTPFHLFKNERFGLSIFTTAHEQSVYEREQSRSKVSIFLNIDVNPGLLQMYNLFAAIGLKFTDDEMVNATAITANGERFQHTMNSSELPGFLSEEISSLETRRRSIHNADLFVPLALTNRVLIMKSTASSSKINESRTSSRKPSSTLSRGVSSGTRNTSVSSTRISSQHSTNVNKPLPTIEAIAPTTKETKTLKNNPRTLKSRLSEIFGMKKKKTGDSTARKASSSPPKIQSHHQATPTLQGKVERQQNVPSDRHVSQSPQNSTPTFNRRGDSSENTAETTVNEDSRAFESSMSPIFDDEFPDLNFHTIPDTAANWVITRENSSINCNLNKMTQLNGGNSDPSHEPKAVELAHHEPETEPFEITSVLFGHQYVAGNFEAGVASQTAQTAQRPKQQPTLRVIKTPPTPQMGFSTPILRNLTFRSIDDEFNSPVLRVGVHRESVEDIANDEDIFYTPKSYKLDSEYLSGDGVFKDLHEGNMFGSFGADTSLAEFDRKFDVELNNYDEPDGDGEGEGEGEEQDEEEATRWSAGGNETDHHGEKKELQGPIMVEHETGVLYGSSSIVSSRTSSFKSCLDDNQLIHGSGDTDPETTPILKQDESFGYLANIFDSPMPAVGIQNSETYQTLPRSFSSHKYLAAFINTDVNISEALYDFLQVN